MISFSVTFAFVSTILSIFGTVSCHPVKYDQRQEGDLNFRTDVEDVVFVVIPPKDLISTGVGIVAATAANFLKNNYGGSGIERWPLRTSSKLGFAPVEKSPYKIDLEGQKMNVKKINQIGDPNRYNFHENKNPSKNVPHLIGETTEPAVLKSSTAVTEMQESSTDSKTENKIIKANDKKEPTDEEKLTAKPLTKPDENKAKAESPLVVIGEFSDGGLGPDSIFALEGCGPDAYRDENGLCVYKTLQKKS